MAVPASRYRPSARSFTQSPPPVTYGPDDHVRKVQQGGWVTLYHRYSRLPRAFTGYPVAFRSTTTDGCFDVDFCAKHIAQTDIRHLSKCAKSVNDVSEPR